MDRICGLFAAGFFIAFGGSSRDHEFRLLAVELAALPLLVMALTQIVETGTWRSHRLLLGLLSAILLLPLAQIVPLPPSFGRHYPDETRSKCRARCRGPSLDG